MNPPYNTCFIQALSQLEDIMQKKAEYMRARAYQKAQEAIMMHQADINTVEDIKNIKGIGKAILAKLQSYVSDGAIVEIEREKNNPLMLLTNVYGVGPKKATELINAGITTILELREREDELLNDIQKLGLLYYEDILERIPRAEVVAYDSIFNANADNVKFEVVGSYRRKQETCGDIDVIVTGIGDNPKLFESFIDRLVEKKIIIHKLTNGSTKVLVIAQLPGKPARRVDFMFTTAEEYPFATLYFTGSRIFNTVMRHRAQEMGYTMNEHGLFATTYGKKGARVMTSGSGKPFINEEDIFDFLGMQYKSPEERIDGRSIVPIPVKKEPIRKTRKRLVIVPSIDDRLIAYKNQGLAYIQQKNISQSIMAEMLRMASDRYYNSIKGEMLSDNQYDLLHDYLQKQNVEHPVLKEIGAPVLKSTDKKVNLPYAMPSMNKIKPTNNELSKWIMKYKEPSSYVLSAKLDGVSGMYVIEKETNIAKLYTRGNGLVGQDITHLLSYLRMPKIQTRRNGFAVRGEFIISKTNFQHPLFQTNTNARNTVAGLINTSKIGADEADKLKKIDFVAYEILEPANLTPLEQLDFCVKFMERTVLYQHVEMLGSNLKEMLTNLRQEYEYEVDGVIVAHNDVHKRTLSNPDYAFAFKMVLEDQVAETNVIDVLWTPSKDGYLKPRVQVEPVLLGGVVIEYTTGFNAAFIVKNCLGPGAKVKLVRSGDVIPYILEISSPAHVPKMPEQNYTWNETRVDVMLSDSENPTVRLKNVSGFFKEIGVVGLGPGNIDRIIKAGNSTIESILAMKKEDFLQINGFEDKLATKLHANIQKQIEEIQLVTLMKATNIFGRGLAERKMAPIIEAYPDILTCEEPFTTKVQKVISVRGMAKKSAEAFVSHIPAFLEFIKRSHLLKKLAEVPKKTCDPTHPLFNKKYVFTGFRDKELEDFIRNHGGDVVSTINANITALIAKDLQDTTGKAELARTMNVPILRVDTFKTHIMNE